VTEKKKDKRNEISKITTFSVPFSLEEINDNIILKTTKQIINHALDLHSQGNVSEAKKHYQFLINQGEKDARIFGNYGIILINLGKLKEAEELLRKAIVLKPDFIEAYSNLSNLLKDLGRYKEAESEARKAIQINPYYFNAHLNLGVILKDLGRFEEAELATREAIKLNPKSPAAYGNMGVILNYLGKFKEAEKSYRKAIELKPNFAQVHCNMGVLLKDLGKLQEAEKSARKAVELKPNLAEAHSNLGTILKTLGKFKEAESSTLKAIKLNPNFADAYLNLGNLFVGLKKYDEAEKYTRKAIKIRPNCANAYASLGVILTNIGRFKEANECFKACLNLDKNDLAYNLRCKMIIPYIPFNQKQIEESRKELNKQISIIGNNEKIILKRELISIDFIFYLAYGNCEDDKSILQNIATNLSKKNNLINNRFNTEERIKDSLKRKKIRLGIYSNYLYLHSVGKSYVKLIEDLNRTDIDVIIIRNENAKEDELSNYIDSIVKETIILPVSLKESCDLIINKSIDILFFLDNGMCPRTYLMSLSRLALVQVLAGGHPCTSGSPNIDYYISSKYLETEDSDKFYSERLIRLSRIPVNYPIPKLTNDTFKRSSLNLSDNDFLIGLTHTLYKYHPDFDYILDKILEEIPNAYLFFFEGEKKYETDLIKKRWKKNTQFILTKTIIHPRAEFDTYLSIIKSFDIILDPFYFGMGNTFFQAMALGIPVVTMPAKQARGRVVFAGYKQMGIKEPPQASSPEEYISICKKLAFDNSYKNRIVNQILSKSKENLFNDSTIFKQYIDFFYESINSAQKRELLPKKWEPISK
tara:strand:- start:16379 stop:18823 length:2445 start_codon:yes stop_codon:yes gene_type:complete